MLSAGSIVGGAFRLVRERPGAVAAWGLVYVAGTIAMGLAMRPVLETQSAALGRDSADAMTALGAAMGWTILLQAAFLALVMVLFTAAQRAVLRPGERGFASIRLGMDELRMIGLALLLVILFYVGLIVVGIALGILMVAIMSTGLVGRLMVVATVEIAVLAAVATWLAVRLSLAYPLTLLRGRITIGEAWRLSRGRFWTLFAGYLVIFLLWLVLAIAAAAVTAGPYLDELMRGGPSLQAILAAGQRQMARQMGSVDATMIVGWALSGLVGGLSLALYGGAVATAARELSVDQEGMARTFG